MGIGKGDVMSENSDTTISGQDNPVVDSSAVNLRTRPFEPEAFRYMKENGFLRHGRWDGFVILANAAGRQITLEEAEVLAHPGGLLICSNPNCGKQFEEPNVMVVRRDADLSADPLPDLPTAMSAHIARLKNGNIRYQGATLIVGGATHSFCGPRYFNRAREDGAVSQIWDNKSCLGFAMKEVKAAAEAALSDEQKKGGAQISVPPPLESSHAETILRAMTRSGNRSADRRREDEERLATQRRVENAALAEEKKAGVRLLFSSRPNQ